MANSRFENKFSKALLVWVKACTIGVTNGEVLSLTDTCKICNMQSGIDWHHEIPQAYGGLHGPQSPLCSGHHSLIHNLALKLYKHGDEGQLVIPLDVPKDKRGEVIRLVRVIVIARKRYEAAKAAGKAPKKGSVVKLDSKRSQRLETCARLLNCSQQDAARTAIDRLYQSLTARPKEQLQQ